MMFVVATAGHVDHGKSTLIRALTGEEPDRWAEERRRGLTIDLGFASTTLPNGRTVAFVDVPGHRRFVPNMLAGVGPVPAVLFVVAADDGWMPQSQEHLDALTALGVRHGVLVITRSDLLDPEPAAEEARAALAGTSLAHIPTVAVSAVTGSGMGELRSALERLGNDLPPADVDADLRLWVDRSFTIGGAGTVVTGTLGAGTVRTGDTLLVGANGPRVVVRGLQSLGRDRAEVPAPARVAVNLRGVANSDIARGDALLTPDRWYETATVDVQLTAPGTLREHVVVHCGSAAIGARVRPLTDAFARLSLEQPLPLRIGDRMILRDPDAGLIPSGAVVLDPAPPELRRRGDARRRAEVLAAAAPDVGSQLRRRGFARARDLRAWGVTGVPDTAGPGDWLLDPDTARSAAERLGKLVDEHARTHPLAPGLPGEAARRALALPDPQLLAAVLEHADALTVDDGRIVRRDAEAGLPEPVAQAAARLQQQWEDEPFVAPSAGELAELGLGHRELAACARAGLVTPLGGGVWLGAGAVDAAVEALRELPEPFTPSEARTRLGTSRRVIMPLLEVLAREGRTRRTGEDGHVVA
ncbi:selenocysteine-specific translation elongation factor [Rhodococcus hoagii]|nr:selenocysteine-specific translation elongation factor [Prescottella equi]NKV30889.1 selenocysteine-specific translation elongation factor [Prescottella equi]